MSVSEAAQAVQAARAALRRGSWAAALDWFDRAGDEARSPSDLEAIADCQWWLARLADSMVTRQAAYRAYISAEDAARAAYNAWFLAYDHFSKGDLSAGSGWLGRAWRVLEGRPECFAHGYLAIADAHAAADTGDANRAQECAETARAIAQRTSDSDLGTVALLTLGQALIAQGRRGDGIRFVDEAMTAVMGAELSAFAMGWVFCSALVTCLELGEVGRAAEWSENAQAWCESLDPGTPYHGLCRVYRVQVLTLRGAWAQAEIQAERAAEELRRFVPAAASAAWYEIGEVRRRRGDLSGAEAALVRAHELGADPQPALALVRLAQGRLDSARAGLAVSLAEGGSTRLQRSRLLAAQVEIAVQAADQDLATSASCELRAIADEFDSPAIRAAADCATGAAHLARGEPIAALSPLRSAWETWHDLQMPYEAARCRMLLGVAAEAAGDRDRATLEWRSALREVERLDAMPEVRQLRQLLDPVPRPEQLTKRELEVLGLLATGRTNREIGADLYISQHTVARHVSSILTKLALTSRTAAVRYALDRGLLPPRGGSQT